MSNQAKRRLNLIYSCVLGTLLIVTGVLFIVSCIGIYNSGDRPFTRESVGAALTKLLIPICLSVAGVIGGAVIKIFLAPDEKKKAKVYTDLALKRLEARYPEGACSPQLTKAIIAQQRTRLFVSIGGAVLLTLSVISSLIYIFTPGRFPAADANGEVLKATAVILISLIPFCCYLVFAMIMINRSMKLEMSMIKASGEPGVKTSAQKPAECKCRVASFMTKHKTAISISLKSLVVVIGITFVLLGIFNDGMNDVLQKAVRICTECIGLG